MDKVKWSFSLIFAFFIVGILGTAAFASDLYSLKAVQTDSGLEVSFKGNPTDSTDIAGKKFDLVLIGGSSSQTYRSLALDSSKNGSYTITPVDAGKSYKLQLYYNDDTSHANMLSQIAVADVKGNGLINANTTGYNNLKKQRSGQKVHGFYQNNTNSCASCHQTHTANDDNLLFKDGVYSTCSACHDGTTGAYNNFDTKSATDTSNSISGSFDISADVAHGSMHQADGTLQISSAPGGNKTPDTTKGSIGAATWGQDFDCSSCHAPHGSGSAAENNLNIDPMGWGGIQYKANGTKDEQNGKLFKGISIHDSVPTSKGDPYILVRTTASGVTSTKSNIGYLYYRAGVKEGDPIIQTYRWDGSVNDYVADYSLWLRDASGYKSAPFKNANTVLYDTAYSNITAQNASSHDITTTGMTVIWRDGFAFGDGVANVKSADLSIGIDIETTSDVKSLYDPTSDKYIPDSGVEMTKYCSACHTDYMIDPTTGDVGVAPSLKNTSIPRQVGLTDELTCVRCHFAHGTKAGIMKDKDDKLATAGSETLSTASPQYSSALRRYINLDSFNFINSLSLSVSANTSPSTSTSPSTTTSTSSTTSSGTTTSTSSTTGSGTTTGTSSTTSSSTTTGTGSTTSSGTDTSTSSTTSSGTNTSTSSTTSSGTDTSTSSTTSSGTITGTSSTTSSGTTTGTSSTTSSGTTTSN